MNFTEALIQSVLILVILILLAYLLKVIRLVSEEQGGLFAKIVTNFTLPALIFSAVSVHRISVHYLLMALIMIISEVVSAGFAWIVAKILKLNRPKTGALILASTFGSSAFLGYAIIKGVYPENAEALADAAIVSELGVGLLIFTWGVFIAIYYGRDDTTRSERNKIMLSFFRSPIFIALILGLICSLTRVPMDNICIKTLYKLLHIIGDANTVFVALTIGVMLKFRDLRQCLVIVLAACFIKLFVQPVVAGFQADILNLKELWKNVLIIETSMPSAALAAVFSKRYGCDAELTAILVFATFISSMFTIITIIFFIG